MLQKGSHWQSSEGIWHLDFGAFLLWLVFGLLFIKQRIFESIRQGAMSKGSQGNEEDHIVLSLRSEINLISKDLKTETHLSNISSALHAVKNDLAELIKIIHDSGENCKSSTSQSSDNKIVTDSQGGSDFLVKEGDKLISHLTGNIKEYLSTCFQQVKGRREDNDENDSRQQEHRPTIPLMNQPDLSMRSLRMKYDVLGPLLKQCLLFLSVFPENEFIKKRSLIYWWIGEGLVSSSGCQTAEQVGEECFNMLCLSDLIEPVSKDYNNKYAHGCKIKDSVKTMLISIAADDNFAFDSQNKPNIDTEKCKRACLVANKKEQVVEVSLDPKHYNLLSLFNVNAQYLACAKNKFSSLESIVVLQLGRWQSSANHHIETDDTKFLDNLGVMENLRYLSLQGISKITMLPDSCRQLTRLQILDLQGCHHLESLPNGITMLVNLTHLDVSECPFLERMPKGLSALSNLQVLKGFILNDRVNGSCELSELTDLKKLRKLNIKAVVPNDMKELENFSSLRSLKICWAKNEQSSLTFPPNLEKLDLQRIPQSESPNWLRPENLKNLKKLYIRGGKLKSLNLATETEKWNVETLRLRFLYELESDWPELKEAFPLLAFIEICKSPKLEAKLEAMPASDRPLIDKDGVWIMKKQA